MSVERTYKGLTRLEKEHFCSVANENGLQDTYYVANEELPFRESFTVQLNGRETDRIMQKVAALSNT